MSPVNSLQSPRFCGIRTFMRQPAATTETPQTDVSVIGVPFDSGVSYRPGTRFGPRAIRAASVTSAWERHWPWEFDPFDHLAVIDYGDCDFDHSQPQQTPAAIEAHADTILAAGCAMLTLGGDHFISYPLLKVHAKQHGTLSLVHFDAHSDTWPDTDEGPQGINHGTMFYYAAKQGLVDPARSVQIGLRTTNDDVMGFQVLDARQVHRSSPEQIAELIRARVGDNPVYLTFDIDCLDPAYAPGTGTPVPGGLSSHQALEILRALRGINLVGMDVVEVSPPYDHAEVTALAASYVAMEMLCLYAARHKVPA